MVLKTIGKYTSVQIALLLMFSLRKHKSLKIHDCEPGFNNDTFMTPQWPLNDPSSSMTPKWPLWSAIDRLWPPIYSSSALMTLIDPPKYPYEFLDTALLIADDPWITPIDGLWPLS